MTASPELKVTDAAFRRLDGCDDKKLSEAVDPKPDIVMKAPAERNTFDCKVIVIVFETSRNQAKENSDYQKRR